VRIFRVDNPHTKPLPFWQWMIADIQSRHPDVLFLAEAFTRPKLMYRLAKVGFSQSYTYFTWRNTKQEITEYLSELTTPPVADIFRPNFFVNTPDINPVFLQASGRAGFLIRAALAATLSGLWGVYSGFEICEAAPRPGRAEYPGSEKYEIRPRNYAKPGNIVAEITALNRIRRQHPALQSHLGLTFYPAYNDQIILYGKRDPIDRSMVLVAVSFDPHIAQEAAFEVPLWEFGLDDQAAISVTDPTDLPFRIWRLEVR
jgi:starch synthase (maltosyl-transferring)